MPNSVRAITRIQDADDLTGSLTNGYAPVYSSGLANFVMSALAAVPTIDTRANVLASSPSVPTVAFRLCQHRQWLPHVELCQYAG